MNTDFHPCAHPGCTRWALYRRPHCGVHVGLAEPPLRPLAAWPASVPITSPLAGGTVGGPFDLVLLQRDSLHRYLTLRPGYRPPALAEELRYLRVLARTASDLAPTMPDTNATDEIGAFLDTIAQRVLDREAREAQL